MAECLSDLLRTRLFQLGAGLFGAAVLVANTEVSSLAVGRDASQTHEDLSIISSHHNDGRIDQPRHWWCRFALPQRVSMRAS